MLPEYFAAIEKNFAEQVSFKCLFFTDRMKL